MIALLLAGGATVAEAQYRAKVWVPGYEHPLLLDTLAHRSTIPAPAPAVYAAAAAVLEEMGIPLALRDSLRGAAGNPGLTLRRRLGKTSLSRYLNCGSGFTGPYADDWRVTMAVVATAEPVAEGTRFWVAMGAGAQDLSGTSTAPVGCGSTGVLEQQIHTRVLAKVAGIGASRTP